MTCDSEHTYFFLALEHILVINLIHVMYVVKDLVRMVAYRTTLKHTLVINVMYVVKDLVIVVTYR